MIFHIIFFFYQQVSQLGVYAHFKSIYSPYEVEAGISQPYLYFISHNDKAKMCSAVFAKIRKTQIINLRHSDTFVNLYTITSRKSFLLTNVSHYQQIFFQHIDFIISVLNLILHLYVLLLPQSFATKFLHPGLSLCLLCPPSLISQFLRCLLPILKPLSLRPGLNKGTAGLL